VRSEEAKSLLKKNWGIDGQISSLPSERDINFKISGKANYVLKIYPKVGFNLEDQVKSAEQSFKVSRGKENKHLSICCANKEQKVIN